MSLDTRFFFSILIQLIHKYMYDHLWFTSKFSHGLSLILSGNLLIFQWTICSILLCILSVKQSAAERQWGPFVKSLVWLDWISNPGLPPIRQTLYVTTRPPSWSILRFHQIFLQTFINWRKTLLGISNESFVWPKKSQINCIATSSHHHPASFRGVNRRACLWVSGNLVLFQV